MTDRVLTPREIEALQEAADGSNVKSSASEHGVTESVVKKQRSTAMLKLGADNMPHAVAMAMRKGLIQ